MKINECKNCGSKQIVVEKFNNIYFVICKSCKNSTKDCLSKKEAIEVWNKL